MVVAPVNTAVADEMAAMNVHAAAAFDDSGEVAVLVDADTLANAQNLAQHSVALEDDTVVGAWVVVWSEDDDGKAEAHSHEVAAAYDEDVGGCTVVGGATGHVEWFAGPVGDVAEDRDSVAVAVAAAKEGKV